MPFPNAGVYPQSFTFRDVKGHTATLRFYIVQGAGTVGNVQSVAQNIEAELAALSNAAIQSSHGPQGQVGTVQYGVSADYVSVQMKARLTWQDVKGVFHRWSLPAPSTAIFLADFVTVNPGASPGIANLITAVLTPVGGASVGAKDGTLYSSFVGGTFAAVRRPRKVSILTLGDNLAPEEPE